MQTPRRPINVPNPLSMAQTRSFFSSTRKLPRCRSMLPRTASITVMRAKSRSCRGLNVSPRRGLRASGSAANPASSTHRIMKEDPGSTVSSAYSAQSGTVSCARAWSISNRAISAWASLRPTCFVSARMAELTGFEPAISCVTGRHVRPLHHSSIILVAGTGFEPATFGL